jgi:hypothetical protein
MLISLVVTTTLAASLAGDTVGLADRPCQACRIVVGLGPRLIEPVDRSGHVSDQSHVARDAQGRFWVSAWYDRTSISVYDASGALIRVIGRVGGGPGEFRGVSYVYTGPHAVAVVDGTNRRVTIFDAQLRYVRAFPGNQRPDAALLNKDGTIAVAGVVPTSTAVGFGLHYADSVGVIVSSTLPTGLLFREDMRELYTRMLTRGADSLTLWVANRLEYAFSRCPRRGDTCTTYLRTVVWFPPPEGRRITGQRGTTPPLPALQGVIQDGPDHVWTIASVPNPAWATAIARPSPEFHITDLDKYYDTIIERIDVRTGSVVARIRHDRRLHVGASGVVWYYDDSGAVERPQAIHLVQLTTR